MASSFHNAISLVRLQSISSSPTRIHSTKCGRSARNPTVVLMLCSGSCRGPGRDLLLRSRASLDSTAETGNDAVKSVGGVDGVAPVAKGRGDVAVLERTVTLMQGAVGSLPPIISAVKRQISSNFGVGLCITFAFLVIAMRQIIVRKSSHSQHGSVADLVKRGQLRPDRRGISRPLKYEDPFNNPLVKVGKRKSTVEMCGKVYRLAPVTLTEEQQSNHQRRRSRAYKWKRPTIFLKEGDPMPPDVDPDTVRWIPPNHPFATTVSDIDEDLAQNNVYQKHGVPFRIKAEHEALQRKLEALQSEEKLNEVAIDPNSIHDFERPLRSFSKPDEELESSSSSGHQYDQDNNPKSDQTSGFL